MRKSEYGFHQIKPKKNWGVAQIICLVFLTLNVIVLLIPYFWGFITSFKANLDLRYNLFGFPKKEYGGWQFQNYKRVFSLFKVTYINSEEGYTQTFYFQNLLYNSLIYSLCSAATPIVVTYLMAYVRNMYDFRFLKYIDGLVYVMMALPVFGTLASSIQVFKFFGIHNNFPAFVLIARFTFGGMNYFIIGTMIKSIPKAFTEAAEIDGAGELQKLFMVMIPLTMGVIMTLYVLDFISCWNDYQVPLIYLNNMPTAAYGIYVVKNTQGDMSRIQFKLCACFIIVLPIMIVFVILHDRLMKGVSLSAGVKE